MPTGRPATAGSRGPVGREPALRPSGYRMRAVPGFVDTLINAENHQQQRAGVRKLTTDPEK